MTINEARLIRAIKRRATYRALAEIYYPKDHPGHGNQLFGEDLCREALDALYPGHLVPSNSLKENGVPTKEFDEENKSFVGDFYWWE